MPDRIVHIGFPKTGTTFLQREVFPLYEELHFLGFSESAQLLSRLVYSDPLDVDLEEIRERLATLTGGDLLVSYENLSGSPFLFRAMNRSGIPQQLKSSGFNKVIVTVRSQIKVIDSYYRQYIALGGTLRFRDFIDLEQRRTVQSRFFELNYLNYSDLIRLYQDTFGEENVLVVTQEDIRDRLREVSDRLASFMEKQKIDPRNATHNISLSNLAISFLRVVNYFTYSHLSPYHLISSKFSTMLFYRIFYKLLDPYLFRLFSSRKSFVEKYGIKNRLADYYQKSNKELQEKFGINY